MLSFALLEAVAQVVGARLREVGQNRRAALQGDDELLPLNAASLPLRRGQRVRVSGEDVSLVGKHLEWRVRLEVCNAQKRRVLGWDLQASLPERPRPPALPVAERNQLLHAFRRLSAALRAQAEHGGAKSPSEAEAQEAILEVQGRLGARVRDHLDRTSLKGKQIRGAWMSGDREMLARLYGARLRR